MTPPSGSESSPATRVAIIEDHALLAETLAGALRAEGVAAEVLPPDAPAAISARLGERPADVVLLDLDLGGHGRGEDLVATLVDTGAQVIVLTGTGDRIRLGRCVELGVHGILDKSRPFEEVLAAVVDAAALQTLMGEAQRTALLVELRKQRKADADRLAPFRQLTPREEQVLLALCEGKSAEIIAKERYLSESTVRSQIRAVLSKVGVNSQLQATAAARRARWEPARG